MVRSSRPTMEVLAMLGSGLVGSVFWVVSTEATAIYYGTEAHWHPLLVGLLCATGQCLTYTLLYLVGEPLVARWSWLQQKVAHARKRFERRLQTAYLTLTGFASVIGLPPMLAMAILGRSFDIRISRLLPVAFVGRTTRFTLLALIGDGLTAWF